MIAALAPPAEGDTTGAGNEFFRVFVEDQALSDGRGVFTATTGPAHQAGGYRDVLFNNDRTGDAATSWLTVRSYTTGTDYVQTTGRPASANPVVDLDAFATVEPLASTGYRTTYDLPGGDQSQDTLRIQSDIDAAGTTLEDARIVLSATLTNTGDIPLALGVRYLLDLAPGGDDGPALETATDAITSEHTFKPAPGVAALLGNGLNVFVIDAGADLLHYAYWPDAGAFTFEYAAGAARQIAGPGSLGDSALLYYFGAAQETAINLAPGDSARVSLSIAAEGPDEPQPSASPTPTPAPETPAPAPSASPAQGPVSLPRTGGARVAPFRPASP
jgi:hypothetical protein